MPVRVAQRTPVLVNPRISPTAVVQQASKPLVQNGSFALRTGGAMGPQGPAGSTSGGWISIKSYSPTGGGANDTAALANAIAAASALGGGTVLLDDDSHGWTGDLVIPDNVSLVGLGSNKSRLVALSSTSRILHGRWSSGDDNPGALRGIYINGAGTGHSGGLVVCQCVFPEWDDVQVHNGAGPNVVLDAAQNCAWRSVVSEASAVASLKVINGSGGYTFDNVHLRSSPICLWVNDDDGSTNNAYPYGSAHFNFFGGIVESYTNGTRLAELDCGATFNFWGTGFSVNDVTMSAGDVIAVKNTAFPTISTYVAFNGCNFNGGSHVYPTIRIVGNQVVTITGDTYYQQTTAFLLADAGTPTIQSYGSYVTGSNVTAYASTVNGGSLVSMSSEVSVPLDFRQRSGNTTVLATRRAADGNTGLRMFLDQDGSFAWSDGTGFSAKSILSYDTTNAVSRFSTGGLRTGGRRIKDTTAQTSVSGAVTINTQGAEVNALVLAGNVTSMTFSNAVDGAQLRVFVGYVTGSETVAWPANARFAGNAAPTGTAGRYNVVEFQYVSGNSLWIETNRSVAVPYS